MLRGRALDALRKLNPLTPGEYLEQALAEVLSPKSQDAIAENFRLHEILVNGYRGISYIDSAGMEQNPTIRFVSHNVDENEFLAVNQVTIRSADVERRFDIVLYLNGLPVVIVELKKAGSEQADVASAHAQLATYLREFPMAFSCCVLTIISDGITARYGTPFTPLNHYSPWNVDDSGRPTRSNPEVWEPVRGPEIEFLIDGVCNPERFLQLQRNFVAFDAGADGFAKRIAKPHQYFAVTKAVGSTVDAVEANGKAGVVWHTQGSGKSMEMELYAHLVALQPKLKNPTLVVVTDRTELDSQLFESFNRSQLLAEAPVNVTTRGQLRAELTNRSTGGIYFTTLQKFGLTDKERAAGLDHPLLTDRRNIIVIVDEAHRSHYDDLDGFARHIRDALPNAAFIAFTGTPISFADRNTEEVFGNVIDTYDLTRAVDDGATVQVYFEPRLISVKLAGEVTEEQLDAVADEATTGLDDVERARIEQSVAVINAVYGAPARLAALAADVLQHWDQRSAALRPFIESPGKALIVGSTREICASLYEEIIKLQPDWHDDAVDKGTIKVVYSGSASDTGLVAKHVRRDGLNKVIQKRLKDPDDPLQIVIVQNMMLTGFDAPPLHTLYLDRPLKGALLMQTLARVNRTFRGKPSGLLVAYAPVAENLSKALAEYTESDRAQKPVGRNVDEAAALARSLIATLDEICSGYPWRKQLMGDARSWIKAAVGLTNYLRSPATPANQVEDGKETLGERFRKLANQLARAWALAAGGQTLEDVRQTARFYEEVRVWMGKFDAQERQSSGQPVPEEIQRLLSTSRGDVDRGGRDRRHLRRCGAPEAFALRARPRVRRQGATGGEPPPRHRSAARPADRRVGQGRPPQPRTPACLLGEAQGADEPLHQPAAHLRGGHRRTDRAGQGGGGRRQPRRPLRSSAHVRRARVLRRRRRERIGRRGAGAGHPRPDRSGTGGSHASRHQDRLDGPRRRTRQTSLVDQAAARQAQVPAGQAARGDPPRHRADGEHGAAHGRMMERPWRHHPQRPLSLRLSTRPLVRA